MQKSKRTADTKASQGKGRVNTQLKKSIVSLRGGSQSLGPYGNKNLKRQKESRNSSKESQKEAGRCSKRITSKTRVVTGRAAEPAGGLDEQLVSIDLKTGNFGRGGNTKKRRSKSKRKSPSRSKSHNSKESRSRSPGMLLIQNLVTDSEMHRQQNSNQDLFQADDRRDYSPAIDTSTEDLRSAILDKKFLNLAGASSARKQDQHHDLSETRDQVLSLQGSCTVDYR